MDVLCLDLAEDLHLARIGSKCQCPTSFSHFEIMYGAPSTNHPDIPVGGKYTQFFEPIQLIYEPIHPGMALSLVAID